MERTEPPLIVIVGPTASGKSSLAIELALRHNGEIICADSRTIYKGMNIGTAKPTREEQSLVPHWGLDLVVPDQTYTVADFKSYADQKIADIRRRGKTPFLVGGTGLYVDAVLFNFSFGNKVDALLRSKLEGFSLDELYKYCRKNNISLPENGKNKRYVIRAIERNGQSEKINHTLLDNILVVGIATEKVLLRQRIVKRSEQIFSQGVVDEAKILGKKYGWQHESMTGNIYPLLHSYLEGKQGIESAKEKFVYLDWQLAKRQLTWFRRNSHIIWLSKDDVFSYIETALAG